MADTPKPKPATPWYGAKKWQYVKQAYYANVNGAAKFPEFRAKVDALKGVVKDWQKVLLSAEAIYLLDIKDSPNQRREDHPYP